MNMLKLQNTKNSLNNEACLAKTDTQMLSIIHRKLMIEAKILYCEGKFTSIYEARRAVPSKKQLRAFMEATDSTECEQHRVLWATSEEIQEYLA